MTPSLKAHHAPRYAALAALLIKHRGAISGRDWELPVNGDGADQGDGLEQDAQQVVEELTRLGPTFVKLGQLLSTRPDLLPPAYIEALSTLREEVDALEPGEAERVIEEELGVRVSKAFASFETRPFAAASLGQVHKAALRDGREVAVKVQRPQVRPQIVEDMEVIGELASFLDQHSDGAARLGFEEMVEQFRRAVIDELDYRREATSQRLLGEQLSHFEHLVIPQPIDDYTTSKVLTMDYVDGKSIGSIGPLGLMEVQSEVLGEELIAAYLEQVLVNGVFHADPHPGNLLLTTDGRIALVDFGMISRITPEVQEQLLRLLLSISTAGANDATEALEHLGTPLDGYDRDRLRGEVGYLLMRYRGATAGEMTAGRMLVEVAKACSNYGLRPSGDLTLLARALLNLDEVARLLYPTIELSSIIEGHAARVMRHRMMETLAPARVMRSVLDGAAFLEALPRRMNKVLESVSDGNLTINLQGLDEPALIRGAQKLANRMATGVLVAAFVIAASLFSRQQSGPMLWGYPLLTIIFLGLAVVVAGWLAVAVLHGDVRRKGPGSPR